MLLTFIILFFVYFYVFGCADNSQNFDTDIFNIPTVKVTTTRPTTPRTTTSRVWTTTPRTTTTTRRSYSPSYPSSGGGSSIFGGGSSNTGGSSIFGDFFGGGSSNTGGSGSNTRHGSGGTGGSSPSSGFGSFFGDILGGGGSSPTTRRPSSSGGSSSSGGLFDDFKNILAGQISNVINDALSNRGGFNTRPIQENKGYRGGLFSENPSSGSGHQQSSSNVAPSSQPSGSSTYTRFGQNTYSSQNSFPTLPPTPPTYGWRVPS